jgi:hypothetical protein
MEQFEQHLADEALRHEFYARLKAFSRCLHISLSSDKLSGPVAVWCRSFDHVMCSKGDEPWAQAERMNFARTRCGSR